MAELIGYLLISVCMVFFGFAIKRYINRTGLNNVLGVSIYYWKLVSKAFILFGTLSGLSFLVALFYEMKYQGFL